MPKINSLPLLALFIFMEIAVTAFFGLTRYYELKSSAYDSSLFAQLLFNITHGNGFITSIAPPNIEQPWHGVHFSPILYLLAPLFYLCPHVEMLAALSSLLIGLAAWPLFIAARRILVNDIQALLVCVLYLINPYVVNAQLWDFHEVAFAPLFFALLALAVIDKKRGLLLVSCAALLATKEHYGLAVTGAGLLWAWHWKEWRFGLALAGFGMTALLLILFVVMPHFSPQAGPAMMNAASSLDRFSWIAHPMEQIDKAFTIVSSGFFYLAQLLLPLWFLPLRALAWLLPGAADFATNTLSANDMMRNSLSYHSAALIPVLLIAFCRALAQKPEGKLRRIDILMASMAIAIFIAYSQIAMPWNKEGNVWEFSTPKLGYASQDATALEALNAMLPPDAPVSAQNNVLPHIALRRTLYHFPDRIEGAGFIALHTGFPFNGHAHVFGAPYSSSTPDAYLAAARKYLADPQWGVVFYEHDWLLLEKGKAGNDASRKAALERLAETEAHIRRLLKNR